jgi:hypothetical protein
VRAARTCARAAAPRAPGGSVVRHAGDRHERAQQEQHEAGRSARHEDTVATARGAAVRARLAGTALPRAQLRRARLTTLSAGGASCAQQPRLRRAPRLVAKHVMTIVRRVRVQLTAADHSERHAPAGGVAAPAGDRGRGLSAGGAAGGCRRHASGTELLLVVRAARSGLWRRIVRPTPRDARAIQQRMRAAARRRRRGERERRRGKVKMGGGPARCRVADRPSQCEGVSAPRRRRRRTPPRRVHGLSPTHMQQRQQQRQQRAGRAYAGAAAGGAETARDDFALAA